MLKSNFVLNNGFKWFSANNIAAKGFLFDSERNYYNNEQLIEYFKLVKTKNELKEKVINATGLFTVVIQVSKTEILIANDIIRAFPIYYSTQKEILHISDSIDEILKSTTKPQINPQAKNEFLSSGFVMGSGTLLQSIHVTQSGHISIIKPNNYQYEPYFNYYTSIVNDSGYKTKKKHLEQIIDEAFKQLVKSLNGRKAVIPLSGGFDSRLIACKLKELNYNNVFCYSYGRATNNQEKIISEKVAKSLGYEWKFIEYNEQITGDYLNDETFHNYVSYYSQYSSCFMFHDYFAVKSFKENDIIPQDAVFIPGHSGDFLGGSHLYRNGNLKYKASLYRIAKNIFAYNFALTSLKKLKRKEIKEKIYRELQNKYQNNKNPLAYSIYEDWEIKEALSKNIAKSAHIYDYFGYEYRLPFWDRQLANFCKMLPYEDKFGKILYDDILTGYFKNFNVNFKEGKILSTRRFQFFKVKKIIKSFLPGKIVTLFKPLPDNLNYEFAQQILVKELTQHKKLSQYKIKHRNAFFTHWYIMQVEKALKKLN